MFYPPRGPIDKSVMADVAEALKTLYERGLVQAMGGNVSALHNGLVYLSPTRVFRGRLSWMDVAVMRLDGSVVRGRPSSEWRMHIAIYRRLDGIAAVVHAHPPALLGADSTGLRLNPSLLMEAEATVGCVAGVPRVKPGTWELAEAVATALEASGCRAAVLRNHGVVAVGRSLWEALDMAEAVEDLARISLYQRLGGGGV
ncbi:aldolase class II protein [Aeropyrum pernix K1]|uniref:Aldolase class II protein n=1 Tax=Aeropyrum pernix (strain ATCC 700893 / DSM 11879 / JCM 9820 / NBRC 100138 / K1) TaxID=272557 RepID=Q9YBE0_AERPE|nr:class II aldolase/adducin family protein [Aeropyrum pernix]BAA80658.2 aldolase class II protein [Aeropyrum pernix K1]